MDQKQNGRQSSSPLWNQLLDGVQFPETLSTFKIRLIVQAGSGDLNHPFSYTAMAAFLDFDGS